MRTGVVKWFSIDKGYGFIKDEDKDGDDVFVHISALKKAGIDDLDTGDRVEFEVETKKDGRRAASEIRLAA